MIAIGFHILALSNVFSEWSSFAFIDYATSELILEVWSIIMLLVEED